MLIKVAGLDPSLNNLGMARGVYDTDTDKLTITALELVKTENETAKVVRRNSDDIRRASELIDGMSTWLGSDIGITFAEIPVGSQSARAMASYGICVGILASVGKAGSYRGRLIQVTPTEVKKFATGSKNASKHEMIEWAHGQWPNAIGWLTRKVKGEVKLIDANEHLADACGAINAGIRTDEFKTLIQAIKNLAA